MLGTSHSSAGDILSTTKRVGDALTPGAPRYGKTIPQAEIRDFCQPPLHKGAFGCVVRGCGDFSIRCHPERSAAESKDLGRIEGAKIPPLAALGRNDRGEERIATGGKAALAMTGFGRECGRGGRIATSSKYKIPCSISSKQEIPRVS